MHQHDVVRAFADRVMELDVDRRLRLQVAGGMHRLHALDDAVEQREVVGGGAARRKFGGDALDLAAVFQIVAQPPCGGWRRVRSPAWRKPGRSRRRHRCRRHAWSSAGRAPRGPSAHRAGSAATRRTGVPARARRAAGRRRATCLRGSAPRSAAPPRRRCANARSWKRFRPMAIPSEKTGMAGPRPKIKPIRPTGQLIYPVFAPKRHLRPATPRQRRTWVCGTV